MENIDNKDEEFIPLTVKRSVTTAYTPTARYEAMQNWHLHIFILGSYLLYCEPSGLEIDFNLMIVT